MAQIDNVYSYLTENYGLNEPIFLSELKIPDMKPVSLRQQLKKLTEDGRLKRFDTGIYYLPKKSMFRFGSMLSPDDVIRKKYLVDDGCRCGYLSGMMFANQLGTRRRYPWFTRCTPIKRQQIIATLPLEASVLLSGVLMSK